MSRIRWKAQRMQNILEQVPEHPSAKTARTLPLAGRSQVGSDRRELAGGSAAKRRGGAHGQRQVERSGDWGDPWWENGP